MESAEVRADPGSRSLRTAALVAGTLGLMAVGVLAIMVTPSRGGSPLAGRSTPTFVDQASLVPLTTALIDRAAAELTGAFGVTRGEPSRTTVASLVSAPVTAPADAHSRSTPLATLLETGVAIVTAKSIAGRDAGDAVAVRLASGRTIDGEVIATIGHAAIVAIGALDGEQAHPVAEVLPDDDTMVTLLGSPPRSVRLADLAKTGAPEGTAVVDADGRLIGLCTRDAAGQTSLAPATGAAEAPTRPTTSAAATTTMAVADTTVSSTWATAPTSTSTTTPATTTTTSTSTTSTSTTTSTVAVTTTVSVNR